MTAKSSLAGRQASNRKALQQVRPGDKAVARKRPDHSINITGCLPPSAAKIAWSCEE